MESQYKELLNSDIETADFWKKQQVYKCYKTEDFSKLYSIDTPPPTVSGKLHIGHVFSYTQADFLARYNRMLGQDVFYPMGFDDNGLATEKFVSKKRGINPSKLPRTELVKIWMEETAIAREEFQSLWTNLGLSIDWSTVYSTISPEVQKVSQTSFVRLYNKGLIERRAEPFMFCTTCQTSVAQAELDWQEKQGEFFKFTVAVGDKDKITIATTRPELIFSCVAIMVHPEDTRYKGLVGKQAVIPLSGKLVNIIADATVMPEKGTGAVICCTFGDQTDVHWFKKHSLELIETIDRAGKMKENTPLAGLTVLQAREQVATMLQTAEVLEQRWKINNGAHVHERCGQSVEFLVTNQWFVKIVENKQTFLDLADHIVWKPEHMKSRYIDWVSNLSWDWCISRQRYFGIAIPAYHCLDCSKTFVAQEQELPVSPIEDAQSKTCPSCNSKNLAPETDVADTWMTSALTPLLLEDWPKNNNFVPMTMRPCAHDIIRTWAFYTIVTTYYHTGQIPWRELNISGHVLAGKGEKISKSKENAQTSPPELIAQHGADAIRYWAAKGKLGVDTVFDLEQIKNGKRTVTKLVNAFKFAFGNIEPEFQGSTDYQTVANTLCTNVSKWLLQSWVNCQKNYHKAFSANDYAGALEHIEKFFWETFCDNYIELVKLKFFQPEVWVNDLQSAKLVMSFVTKEILKMYAPFLPFCTERLFLQYFRGSKSIALENFSMPPDLVDPSTTKAVSNSETLIKIVTLVRRIKSESKVSLKTPISGLLVKTGIEESDNDFTECKMLLQAFAKSPEDRTFLTGETSTTNSNLRDLFDWSKAHTIQSETVQVTLWF